MNDFTVTCFSITMSGLSVISYISDWIVYIIILLVVFTFGIKASPRYTQFHLQDISIMHRYIEESQIAISTSTLVLLCVIIPIFQIIILSVISMNTLERKLWDIFCGFQTLCGAQAFSSLLTTVLKNIAGIPRPDFLSRCQPSISMEPIISAFEMKDIDICTNPDQKLIQEGFKSFPSGHSSAIFCSMTLCSLQVSATLHAYDHRAESLKLLAVFSPLILATAVAATRISDNRHSLRDVICGAVIGSSISIWFYVIHFPWVFNLYNHGRAYNPRRYNLRKFFGNIGGHWSLNEKLPSIVDHRSLNSDIGARKLEEAMQVSVDSEISANIKLINHLNQKSKSEVLDLRA